MATVLPPIAVCHMQDPLDPKVWSKTPANVSAALKAVGRLGPAIHGLKHDSFGMKLRAGLTALRYGDPFHPRNYLHGASMRAAHAKHIMTQVEQLGVSHVLHFSGERYLPLPENYGKVKNYLLIDSSWSYWNRGRKNTKYLSRINSDMRKAYHQMDHIFSISEHGRDSLIADYDIDVSSVSVVGSGPGSMTPYLGPKNYEQPFLLFVARDRFKEKGGWLLLSAFEIAKKSIPSLELWIVGPHELAGRLSLIPGVHYFSNLPFSELEVLFQKASLFAMPALLEPWGLVYLEALRCRTPILGLNRGAIAQISQNGRFGFIVDGDTPHAVSESIIDALGDPWRLLKMGTEGQAYSVDYYTWENLVKRMLLFIDGGLFP